MSDDPQAPTTTVADTPTPTPAPAPADTGNGQPAAQSTVDWEKRYTDLQPEYTRASQEAAQFRQLVEELRSDDPDTRLNAAQALGLELVDDTTTQTPTDDEDPLASLRAEIDEIKSQKQIEQQQRQEMERLQQVETHVEQQLAELDGLDDADKDWIVQRAIHMDPTPEGMPDIQGAHQAYVQLINAKKQAWAGTKASPAPPSVAGTSGTQVPDLDKRSDRVAWMAEKLQANER